MSFPPESYPGPYPPQPQPAKRRVWPFVLAGGVAVLVAALVGAIAAIVTSGTDAGGPVAGQLKGTYPTKPTVTWQLDADEVFDRANFVRPDSTSFQYLRPGFLDLGDTLVTTAVLPQSDRPASLVGVDAATGEIAWTAEAGFKPLCATAAIDGLLPCVGEDPTFGLGTAATSVRFIDLADGTVDHAIEVPEHTYAVAVQDSAVYTFGYDPEERARVITKGSATDLTADWRQTYPDAGADDQCPGSGDTDHRGVDGGVVYNGSDIGVTVAAAEDGRRLADEDLQHLTVYPGQGFAGRTCTADHRVYTTRVFNEQGRQLDAIEADAMAGIVAAEPWLVAPDTEQPFIFGRTAYEFGSGAELWQADGADEINALRTVIGDTVLAGGHWSEGLADPLPLAAFDLATGQHLWTRDLAGELELSDGQRVLIGAEETLTAVHLGTGDIEWTLNLPGRGYLEPAGQGFAAMDAQSLRYYAPTGPAAVAPGRASITDTDGPDRAGLITKCGKTPELTPVEYRTEDGALIVTMQIKASCPGGDIVSTDDLRIRISDPRGEIAAGTFDFSEQPLLLPGEDYGDDRAVEQDLKFEVGSFWRLPNSLGESGGSGSTGNGPVAAAGDQLVDCTDEGTSRGPDRVEDALIGELEVRTASGTGTAPDRDPEAVALDALRAQADADAPFISSDLAERWVPQVSSKQPGLVAVDVDGTTMVTWTPQQILDQHLRLRMQYPEVRLLWSDEWSSFDIRSWWVTVAGLTFAGPDEANGWCDSHAIPTNECFAKLVSNSRGPEGTTKYRW